MVVSQTAQAAPRRRTALLVVLAAATLVLVAPSPAAAFPALLRSSDDPTSPLLAAVGLGAWACGCWLLGCTALTAAGRLLPGASGRAAQELARRCAPRAVRRVAELAVGVTVATAVLGGTGALAADRLRAAADTRAAVSRTTPVPAPQLAPPLDLDWPAAPAAGADAAARSAPRTPTTGAPTTRGPTSRAPTNREPTTGAPTTGAPTISRTDGREPSAAAPVRRTAATVLVQPGDCLWDLARASLGPAASDRQVAAAWPSWWSANRALIGDDPDLLQPGMHLVPPTI